MNTYTYQLSDFALSEKGIHLLRNGYNYKTITYQDVDKASIKWGAEIKNAHISLLIGIALFSFSVLKCLSLYQDFTDPLVHTIYIESILLPLFPLLVGAYFMYAALKRGPVLQLEHGKSRHTLRLREIQKSDDDEGFKRFLREKLSFKLEVEDYL